MNTHRKLEKASNDDTRHFIADITKIRKIGYEPKVKREEDMEETINWIDAQKAEDVRTTVQRIREKKLILIQQPK